MIPGVRHVGDGDIKAMDAATRGLAELLLIAGKDGLDVNAARHEFTQMGLDWSAAQGRLSALGWWEASDGRARVPRALGSQAAAWLRRSKAERVWPSLQGPVKSAGLFQRLIEALSTEWQRSPSAGWDEAAFAVDGTRVTVCLREVPLMLGSTPGVTCVILGDPEGWPVSALATRLSQDEASRRRLALYGMGAGLKMNLTGCPLTVSLERHLREHHGWRFGPSTHLTQALIREGILHLET
ncbi:MAG: hypothetical protein AB1576_01025 [Bacillota bacterium]